MTAPLDPKPPATGALALQTLDLTKRFGSFTAMDRVSMTVAPGSVHALLGENGAGKSTLVKCVAGSQRAEEGSILIDGRERDIATPVVARGLGIGMVYQHFTLAPGMSVAENLLLAGGRTPALIDWARERRALQDFLQTTPFRLDLDATPAGLAAGEKQKLELLKQLYLKPRLLILDEPTSVLTPQEADEVLAYVRAVARRGECTVLMITHKFREVMAYADEVTVLRRGRKVHGASVASTTPGLLAQTMIGEGAADAQPFLARRDENRRLKLRALPEEPLRNACVGELSVAANMALRDFDQPPLAGGPLGWLRFGAWRERARAWIAEYAVKTRSESTPIAALSGGNVQRAVLARELAGEINVLIAANPVFGLDFAAVSEIHDRILQVRARGGAVLLISEDLDELLELSDRIAVMSEGRLVFETPAAAADRRAHMGGGDHGHAPADGAPPAADARAAA
ncbi:ATP-binding cassette domain-containing protein [Piscinibacter sakaiensis]|uniref:ABC transporter ATP-binding protein n=1 Tax=Piscinibacter sakaiensis TaxID=1547922 RepID=UPI00372B9950